MEKALADLARAAADVVDFADATGCTEDLTVTSAVAVEQLAEKLTVALAVLRK
jgi:hypothetical protein